MSINGYNHFFNDRRINQLVVTVMYVKNELKYEIINKNYNKLCTTIVEIIHLNECTLKVTGMNRCHD